MNEPNHAGQERRVECLVGQPVLVDYTDGSDDENYVGGGMLLRLVPPGDWALFGDPHEPMCMVKTDENDSGSFFPTRCIQPNTNSSADSAG